MRNNWWIMLGETVLKEKNKKTKLKSLIGCPVGSERYPWVCKAGASDHMPGPFEVSWQTPLLFMTHGCHPIRAIHFLEQPSSSHTPSHQFRHASACPPSSSPQVQHHSYSIHVPILRWSGLHLGLQDRTYILYLHTPLVHKIKRGPASFKYLQILTNKPPPPLLTPTWRSMIVQ